MEQKITVGIPVYNGEKFIAKTLDSILNQTYKNLEIIVSDNGSSDKTVEIVTEYIKKDRRLKLNQNVENLGYSGNLNKIIELSDSEYIAIYHADDIYEATIIEEQVKFLQENKELAGCFTLGKMIDENGKLIKNSFFCFKKLLHENNIILSLEDFLKYFFIYGGSPLICPTSMIRKTVYLELNFYDTNLKYIEDQDMWIRILERYKLGIISKELINYRIHSNQGSNYYSNVNREELSVHLDYIKEYFSKNTKFGSIFKKELNINIAKDYLRLVKNNLKLQNIEKVSKYIETSKLFYKFQIFSKFGIIQKCDNKLFGCFVRLILNLKK